MGFALTKLGRTVFTLAEIMIVVAVIVLHVASTIPAFLRPRKRMNGVEILNGVRLTDRRDHFGAFKSAQMH